MNNDILSRQRLNKAWRDIRADERFSIVEACLIEAELPCYHGQPVKQVDQYVLEYDGDILQYGTVDELLDSYAFIQEHKKGLADESTSP